MIITIIAFPNVVTNAYLTSKSACPLAITLNKIQLQKERWWAWHRATANWNGISKFARFLLFRLAHLLSLFSLHPLIWVIWWVAAVYVTTLSWQQLAVVLWGIISIKGEKWNLYKVQADTIGAQRLISLLHFSVRAQRSKSNTTQNDGGWGWAEYRQCYCSTLSHQLNNST